MKQFKFSVTTLLTYLLTLNSAQLFADENGFWIDPTENLRFTIDLSVNPKYNFNNNHISHTEAVGFDLHKVFTSDHGDIGTLLLQGYLIKLNNEENPASFYNGENDLKFKCRICNFNLVILDRGTLNFRVGHYETPFGLEYNIDTNGTLKQYSNDRDLGDKLDWGVTVNGKLPWVGYELSLGRGSGVDWTGDYHNYIISGRVETTDGYSSFLGFSAFHGHLKQHNSPLDYVDRTRIGLDASTQVGPLTFLGEISVGQDNSTDRYNYLLEVDIHDKTEKILGFFQLKNTSYRFKHHHWDNLIQTSLGISYTPDRYWTISSQWTHDIEAYETSKRASILEVQLRYRF